MSKLDILVVEDDPLCRKLIADNLHGHAVDFAEDKHGALRKLERGEHDICFIDLVLGDEPGASGLDLIAVASAKGVYSVVMSGYGSDKVVEKAYALGCDDFYAKGNETSSVNAILARFHEKRRTADKDRVFEDRYVTQDPQTRETIRQALAYAPSDLPVLLLGPSGTGKTSLARVIHDYSGRTGEFVSINCSAYTEDLLEAELFGYRKGAFTGATESRRGKLLAADRGTLFLDEIGSMSLKMQTKLLKAIEERSFYPLGADKPETSQFRVVSATLEDLQRLIAAGKLRFDFFQRIHGLTVSLKPLSQRACDVMPLVSFFTRQGRRIMLSAEAKAALLAHDWPGNIRELKKFVDLITAGEDSRVSGEAARRVLASLRVQAGSGFVTEEQYRLALDKGLDALVDSIVDGVIKRNLADNGGKKRKTLADLKIATRILYNSLRRDMKDSAAAEEVAAP